MSTIRKAMSRMVLKHPFYAAMALMSPIKETDSVPTAATDGDAILVNPDFMAQFSADAQVFIISHEIEHIVRLHCHRRGPREARLWNIAADHGINLDLMDQGMSWPKDDDGNFVGLADTRFKDMSADRVYELLQQEQQSQNSGGGDTEDVFDGDVLEPGASSNTPGEAGGPISGAERAAKEREVRGRIQQAAAQVRASKGIDSIPAHLRQMIGELSEPQVDWRHELREFMTASASDDYSWARLNRRVRHRGMKLPSMHSTTVGAIAVIVDTSGSVHKYIADFLSELVGIADDAKPEAIHVLFCDTEVQEQIETTADDFEADMADIIQAPPFGGGTDLRVGFSAVEQLPDVEAVVCLTDMMTPWPEQFSLSYATLFVDIADQFDAPFGRKVCMNS